MNLPDFFIIGAMKCGTSTLQSQLAWQHGVFMTTPKEPNFFSNDEIYSNGMDWYKGLFEDASPGDLKGEASTHYTKLPTFPQTVVRIADAVPTAKFIYVIRDPIERLVSHYIHEWSMGNFKLPLDLAVQQHPEMIAYSRYAMQIAPFIEAFGSERIFLTSLETIKSDPQEELKRVGAFLGLSNPPDWVSDSGPENVSAKRIRRFPMYDLLIEHPVSAALRRVLVPKSLRRIIRGQFQMKDRPELGDATRVELADIFAADLLELVKLIPDASRHDIQGLGSS